MTSDDITKSQANEIFKALFKGTNYLVRLKNRMEAKGFPRDDKLYVLVCNAYEAALRLGHEVHHMSCDGSNGRPARPE